MESNESPKRKRRSTKVHSQQRRQDMSAELQEMRGLLPAPGCVARQRHQHQQQQQQAMSQIDVLAHSCGYIAKNLLFQHFFQDFDLLSSGVFENWLLELSEVVPGFILVWTPADSGRILYASDNVSVELEHPLEDFRTRFDTVLDLVAEDDHATLRRATGDTSDDDDDNEVERRVGRGRGQMYAGQSCGDASWGSGHVNQGDVYANDGAVREEGFVLLCRMKAGCVSQRNSSINYEPRRLKTMLVCGRRVYPRGGGLQWSTGPARCEWLRQPVIVVHCRPSPPLLDDDDVAGDLQWSGGDTMNFQTVHSIDMRFLDADHNGRHYLGFGWSEDICGRSWYALIHRQDMKAACNIHTALVANTGTAARRSLCIRFLSRDTGGRDVIWVHIVLCVRDAERERMIVCWNRVISAQEAAELLTTVETTELNAACDGDELPVSVDPRIPTVVNEYSADDVDETAAASKNWRRCRLKEPRVYRRHDAASSSKQRSATRSHIRQPTGSPKFTAEAASSCVKQFLAPLDVSADSRQFLTGLERTNRPAMTSMRPEHSNGVDVVGFDCAASSQPSSLSSNYSNCSTLKYNRWQLDVPPTAAVDSKRLDVDTEVTVLVDQQIANRTEDRGFSFANLAAPVNTSPWTPAQHGRLSCSVTDDAAVLTVPSPPYSSAAVTPRTSAAAASTSCLDWLQSDDGPVATSFYSQPAKPPPLALQQTASNAPSATSVDANRVPTVDWFELPKLTAEETSTYLEQLEHPVADEMMAAIVEELVTSVGDVVRSATSASFY